MQDLNQVVNDGCAVASVNSNHIFEGLVPIAWLETAAKLPGKSMHLAIALLCIATVEQVRGIALSNLACERFGLNRNSKYRALQSLENAALITADRKPGRSPIVIIQFAQHDEQQAFPRGHASANPPLSRRANLSWHGSKPF